IQAWFRGVVTRAHLRRLHECATTLQRHWRGYRTRILARRYLIEHVHQMWQDYYDSMATRIQAIWRGYWARKTRANVVQLRRWLRAVYAKNDEV
ncbi:Spermatogenesis-associated protein 17, partial [Harpegnathos saltator]